MRLVCPCVTRQGLYLGPQARRISGRLAALALHLQRPSGSAAVFLDTAATGSYACPLKQALRLQTPLPCSGERSAHCSGSDHSQTQIWPDLVLSDGA